jgi:hypothetical protein
MAGKFARRAHGCRCSATRLLSTDTVQPEKHLLVDTSVGNGVVVLELNRAAARNSLSQLLINQFRHAMREYRTASCIVLKVRDPLRRAANRGSPYHALVRSTRGADSAGGTQPIS